MPRSDSASYLGNPKLKAAGVSTPFTIQQLRESQKCKEDPIYFIKKYVKIVHVDKGTIPFALYPFQEEMIRKFVNNRFVIVRCPRQVGKCLAKDTKITVRNRTSGDVQTVTMEQFFNFHKPPFFVRLGKWLKLIP